MTDTPTNTTAPTATTFGATLELVREFTSRYPVEAKDMPGFIMSVHEAILKIANSALTMPTLAVQAPVLTPAVPVDQSVTEDYIVCLEDGSKHRMMKRYLMRKFQMTPDDYRAKWSLGKDYPMTAASHSAKQREGALRVGLGTTANKSGVKADHVEDAMAA